MLMRLVCLFQAAAVEQTVMVCIWKVVPGHTGTNEHGMSIGVGARHW
ncbi:hypothetical protein [Stomatohabitans albus]